MIESLKGEAVPKGEQASWMLLTGQTPLSIEPRVNAPDWPDGLDTEPIPSPESRLSTPFWKNMP